MSRNIAAFLAIALMSVNSARSAEVKRSLTEPVEDRIIHITADLAIPPQKAFAYFTTNPLLQSWLAPQANVTAAAGGSYELFWDPAHREDNSTIGCRITGIAPGEMVAFQWRSPTQFKPFANGADPLTHVVVAFVATASGTRVHLVHSGWHSSTEWEEARRWQDRAWRLAFKELERVAGTPAAH